MRFAQSSIGFLLAGSEIKSKERRREQGMTDDEKRQQKAMLLLECQEAEEELAQLIVKADCIAERIGQVRVWLQEVTLNPADGGHIAAREKSVQGDPEMKLAMDYDRVEELVNHLKESRSKVARLKEGKEKLGLK
jgi:hypothetical protein